MPRYFFDAHDGFDRPERVTLDLSGPDEARAQALATASDMLKDHATDVWSGGDWTMDVVDETGQPVCRLRFVAERGAT